MADFAGFAFNGGKKEEWVQEELDFPESLAINYQIVTMHPEQLIALCDEANERHARGEITNEELDAILAECYHDVQEESLTPDDIELAYFIGKIASNYQPKILVK